MLDQLRNVFSSLEKHQVKYLTIGGIAAIFHGIPRATFDPDILIEATESNVRKMLEAFLEAGLGSASLTSVEQILSNEIIIFKDRIRIDVQTRTPGLEFNDAWSHRISKDYNGTTINLISFDDLVLSKKTSARPKDLEDVRWLEQIRKPE